MVRQSVRTNKLYPRKWQGSRFRLVVVISYDLERPSSRGSVHVPDLGAGIAVHRLNEVGLLIAVQVQRAQQRLPLQYFGVKNPSEKMPLPGTNQLVACENPLPLLRKTFQYRVPVASQTCCGLVESPVWTRSSFPSPVISISCQYWY